MADAVNIILKEEHGNPEFIFVDVELDNGKSICIGEIVPRKQKLSGMFRIRITPADIENA